MPLGDGVLSAEQLGPTTIAGSVSTPTLFSLPQVHYQFPSEVPHPHLLPAPGKLTLPYGKFIAKSWTIQRHVEGWQVAYAFLSQRNISWWLDCFWFKVASNLYFQIFWCSSLWITTVTDDKISKCHAALSLPAGAPGFDLAVYKLNVWWLLCSNLGFSASFTTNWLKGYCWQMWCEHKEFLFCFVQADTSWFLLNFDAPVRRLESKLRSWHGYATHWSGF